jgi:hypothetical protein
MASQMGTMPKSLRARWKTHSRLTVIPKSPPQVPPGTSNRLETGLRIAYWVFKCLAALAACFVDMKNLQVFW